MVCVNDKLRMNMCMRIANAVCRATREMGPAWDPVDSDMVIDSVKDIDEWGRACSGKPLRSMMDVAALMLIGSLCAHIAESEAEPAIVGAVARRCGMSNAAVRDLVRTGDVSALGLSVTDPSVMDSLAFFADVAMSAKVEPMRFCLAISSLGMARAAGALAHADIAMGPDTRENAALDAVAAHEGACAIDEELIRRIVAEVLAQTGTGAAHEGSDTPAAATCDAVSETGDVSADAAGADGSATDDADLDEDLSECAFKSDATLGDTVTGSGAVVHGGSFTDEEAEAYSELLSAMEQRRGDISEERLQQIAESWTDYVERCLSAKGPMQSSDRKRTYRLAYEAIGNVHDWLQFTCAIGHPGISHPARLQCSN